MSSYFFTKNKFTRENIHSTLFFFSLVLIALTLPFSIHANSISIILLTLNWLIEGDFYEKWKKLKTASIAILFIGLYGIYILGMLYTENLSFGFFNLEKKMALFFLPLILSTSRPLTVKEFSSILQAFVFSCASAAFICLGYAIYRNYAEGYSLIYLYKAIFYDVHSPNLYAYLNYWYFSYDFFASFIGIHPVYFSMYLVFCCFTITWYWWKNKTSGRKAYTGVVLLFLIFNLFIIILLSARMPILAFIIITIPSIAYYGYKKKLMIIGFFLISAVLITSLSIIYINPVSHDRFHEMLDINSNYKDNHWGGRSLRFHKWTYAMQVIREHPVFGVGTGDRVDELQKSFRKNNFQEGIIHEYNAHNQYLEITLALGMIGGLLLLACIAVSGYVAIAKKDYLHLMFIILFSLCCLTESMLESNKGVIFFSFFCSLFAFHHFPKRS